MTEPAPAAYTVKQIETIAEGSDLRARLYTLAPGDVIPWHWHSAVTDWYFVLEGQLRIETRAPRADARIMAGERYAILPKTAHRISNGGAPAAGPAGHDRSAPGPDGAPAGPGGQQRLAPAAGAPEDCRFLLLQGVGIYDFNPIKEG